MQVSGAGTACQRVLLVFDTLSVCSSPCDKPYVDIVSPLLQQWRVLPYLAAAYALVNFSVWFHEKFIQFMFGVITENSDVSSNIFIHTTSVIQVYHHFTLCSSNSQMLPLTRSQSSQPQPILGREIHAISSSSKPISSWLARDGIQECREACGGHGFLAGEDHTNTAVTCAWQGLGDVQSV